MSISDFAPLGGATFPATGGTGLTVSTAGTDLNLHRLFVPVDSIPVQRTFDFTVIRPKPNASAPNGYTQARREVVIKYPILLDNGLYTTNTARISISSDIEFSDSEMRHLRDLAVQAINESDMDSFYNDLATA